MNKYNDENIVHFKSKDRLQSHRITNVLEEEFIKQQTQVMDYEENDYADNIHSQH